jgi:hypothetical protein
MFEFNESKEFNEERLPDWETIRGIEKRIEKIQEDLARAKEIDSPEVLNAVNKEKQSELNECRSELDEERSKIEGNIELLTTEIEHEEGQLKLGEELAPEADFTEEEQKIEGLKDELLNNKNALTHITQLMQQTGGAAQQPF